MPAAQLDFAAVIGALPNALMILDRDLRYVAANDAYLKTTGAQLDRLLGSHVFAAFPDDPTDPNNAPTTDRRFQPRSSPTCSSHSSAAATRRPGPAAASDSGSTSHARS